MKQKKFDKKVKGKWPDFLSIYQHGAQGIAARPACRCRHVLSIVLCSIGVCRGRDVGIRLQSDPVWSAVFKIRVT